MTGKIVQSYLVTEDAGQKIVVVEIDRASAVTHEELSGEEVHIFPDFHCDCGLQNDIKRSVYTCPQCGHESVS